MPEFHDRNRLYDSGENGKINHFKKIAVRENDSVRHHCYINIIVFFAQDVNQKCYLIYLTINIKKRYTVYGTVIMPA